jgi:signal transduction histidine kinase
MPATEPTVHSPSAELEGFLSLAMHELKVAAGFISAYAALLEAQIAEQPEMDVLREIVRDVRGQADLVAGLVDDALD